VDLPGKEDKIMALRDEEIESSMPPTRLEWNEGAKALMKKIPFFVRKSAVRGIEEYARARGVTLIDESVVAGARAEREQGSMSSQQAGAVTQSSSATMTQPQQEAEKKEPPVKRQFVSFMFYKVDPAWRRLPPSEREQGKKEFTAVVDEYSRDKKIIVVPYSTVGTRCDCDFVLWRISYSLEAIQELSARLLATKVGHYLHTPYAYLAMTKRSVYVDKIHPEHEEQRLRIIPGKMKYLFVYPFVKTPEWYLLTKHARQGMMDEHIEVGTKYPSVKLNTAYSFGLDDPEFVVAFETDKPEDFLDLVMELRETQGRLYTQLDTPIFTCIRKNLPEALDLLGG
jgi:chlorite dismutase